MKPFQQAKQCLLLSIYLIGAGLYTDPAKSAEFKAMFSPYEGKKAFAEVFEQISSAQDYVYVTVYSWSMRDEFGFGTLESAIQSACDNGAQVFAVVNSDQKETKADVEAGDFKKLIKKKKNDIIPLLKSCAMFKYTDKTMHEKFVVVDDRFAVNTSANFSGGAVNKYSENFVFAYDNEEEENELSGLFIEDLKREFEFLYNYAFDPSFSLYSSDPIFEELGLRGKSLKFSPSKNEELSFYSTGMNKTYTLRSDPRSGSYLNEYEVYDCKKDGKPYRATSKKSCDNPSKATKSKLVVDMIAGYIDDAQHSVFLGVNYLSHRTVCDAVKRAVKRDLDIRIVTDNKQINTEWDCTRVLSKKYAKSDKISSKFRYKVYSHKPSRINNHLQHSKYLLIDYMPESNAPVTDLTKLITGSHNISLKAENENFENMVVFETGVFSKLYDRFYEDFDKLFHWGRSRGDRISKKQTERILKPSRGRYKIHFGSRNTVTTMTLKEAESLKNKLKDRAEGIFDADEETLKNCEYYNPKTGRYSGGRDCNS